MPQSSTLFGAFSGIAKVFLVALDFCKTEQNCESDCESPRLRTIPQMRLASSLYILPLFRQVYPRHIRETETHQNLHRSQGKWILAEVSSSHWWWILFWKTAHMKGSWIWLAEISKLLWDAAQWLAEMNVPRHFHLGFLMPRKPFSLP